MVFSETGVAGQKGSSSGPKTGAGVAAAAAVDAVPADGESPAVELDTLRVGYVRLDAAAHGHEPAVGLEDPIEMMDMPQPHCWCPSYSYVQFLTHMTTESFVQSD